MQVLTRGSNSIIHFCSNFSKGAEEKGVRLKAKGTAHKHCTLIDKVFPLFVKGVQANHFDTVIHMQQTEQLSKWMANGGSQLSPHCWSL